MNSVTLLLIVTFASLYNCNPTLDIEACNKTSETTPSIAKSKLASIYDIFTEDSNPCSPSPPDVPNPDPDIVWDINSDMNYAVKNCLQYYIYVSERDGFTRIQDKLCYIRKLMEERWGGYWSANAYTHGWSKVQATEGYYGVFEYDDYTWVIHRNLGI